MVNQVYWVRSILGLKIWKDVGKEVKDTPKQTEIVIYQHRLIPRAKEHYSSWDTIGLEDASNTRDPWFDSSHLQILCRTFMLKRDKNSEKEACRQSYKDFTIVG